MLSLTDVTTNSGIVAMFVIFDYIYLTKFVDVFMIYHQTKFYLLGSNGSLVTATKPKVEENVLMTPKFLF
jgi:hypothetical protein